jgi:rhodanese-related sulfurtransferase
MPAPIDRDEVKRLRSQEHARLVEVLPADEYTKEHLPDPVNIPLKTLDQHFTALLDRRRPVIVYCYDYQRDLSPRAALPVECIGFAQVYD